MSAPVARSLAARAGVIATALAALVIVLLTVGIPAVTAIGIDAALRERAAGDGRVSIAVVQVRAVDDAPNARAEAAILDGAAPVPLLTRHVFATAPLAATWDGGGGDLVLAVLRAEPGAELFSLRDGREPLGGLAEGRMPERAGEAVMDAPTAARLGIDLGDAVLVDGRDPLEIVGIWSPSSAGTRLLAAAGLAGGGVFTTAEAVFVGDSAPYERWILELDARAMGSDALDGDGTVAERVTAALETDAGIPSSGVVIVDELSPELAELRSAVTAADGILLEFVAVGVALAAVALLRIGAMVAVDRSAELALLRSRGASRTRIGLSIGAVSGAAAIAGSLAGVVVVLVVAVVAGLVLGGGPRIDPMVLGGAPVVVAAAAAIAIGTAGAVGSRDAGSPPGMLARVVPPFAAVAVAVLAALATIGLWSGSSPIAPAAPALVLVAATVVLLAVARPIAAAIGRRGVATVDELVGARRAARRPARFAAALAITAIQVGIVVLAAATAGSTAAIAAQARALDTGAGIRAVGGAAATGLGAAVLVDDLDWGDRGIELVAMTGSGAASALEPVEGLVDPETIAAGLGDSAPGIGVGDGRVAIAAAASGGSVLWFADAAGTLARIPIAADDESEIELPDGVDWRLIGLDARAGTDGFWRLSSLVADGDAVDLAGWRPTDDEVLVAVSGGGIDVTAPMRTAGGAPGPAIAVTVRLVPPDPVEVAAVIDRQVADIGGLGEGDPFTARIAGSGRQLEAVIAAVVPAIPGTGTAGGVMLELRAMLAEQLRTADAPPEPDERWIGAADAAQAAAIDWPAGVRLLGSGAGVHERIVGVAIAAAWASAALALVLAVIAIAATSAQRIRLDRAEAVAMRAMGVDAAGIRGAWTRELAPLALIAAIVGLVAGAVAAAVTVPIIAWRAVPGSPGLIDPVLRVDVLGLAIALVVVVVVGAALVVRGAAAAGRSVGGAGGGARW